MKQLIIFVAALFLTTYSFAIQPLNFAESETLNMLRSAWKNQALMHAKENKNDIAIVYGGADISKANFNIQTVIV